MARLWLVFAAFLFAPTTRVAAQPQAGLSSSQFVGSALSQLETAGPDGRRTAAEALGAANDARSVGALIVALKDEDYEVRRAAVLGLWKLGALARPRLLDVLHDEQMLIRRGACEVLGLSEDHGALDALLDAM